MKVLTVLGARPQFVKASTVSRELKKHNVEEIILHTGQHFDQNMSQIFFDEMDIPKPNFNLNIHGLSHGAMTGRMIEGIEKIMLSIKPDLTLVYGDTNSTLAGALASKKLLTPVAHVEAGLRSFNMAMPEELNRILTDRISNFLFCPTQVAEKNLYIEGFKSFNCTIKNVGDVMLDAALYYSKFSSNKSSIIKQLNLSSVFALATIHRQENTDNSDVLTEIVESLNEINNKVQLVVPLHPRTKKILESIEIKPEFKIIPPVGYFDMVELLKNCSLVITDSGGLQKEAFFFSKPCVTIRNETEWVELVDGGYNLVAGTSKRDIIKAFNEMMEKKIDYSINLYGDGDASKRIAEQIKSI